MIWTLLAISGAASLGAIIGAGARHSVMTELARDLGDLEALYANLRLQADDYDDAIEHLTQQLEQAAARQIPDVADSPAWSARPPLQAPGPIHIDVDQSLGVVLAIGNAMRACARCGAQSTESSAVEYEFIDGEVAVCVNEECQSCGQLSGFKINSQEWTCMEAMRAWEGCRTARALFKSESEHTDLLDELDQE